MVFKMEFTTHVHQNHPGNVVNMKILRQHTDLMKQNLGMGPKNPQFKKLTR